MPAWKSVAIIGVGLIGGSIGLALRRRKLAGRVIGIGRRQETLQLAANVGAIDESTLDLARGVADAELVLVCTPVDQIANHVLAAGKSCPAGTLITDAGSTKAAIVGRLNGSLDKRARFIGSHPLAGSEKQGPAEANSDLFVGRTVIITPSRRNTSADRQQVEEFWNSLGANVVTMTPAAHDRAVASSSHLVHVVAAILAASVPRRNHPLTAGGFRDTTRIAAGDPELWTQILLDNRSNILRAINQFDRNMTALRQALEAGSRSQLKKILSQAKIKRDALGN